MQCLPPVLTIAAGLAHRDPFVLPVDRKHAADEARRALARGAFSDHVALLNAYDGWAGAGRGAGQREFCWRNFLSHTTLEMMHDMRR